jgi:hypothetical protein
MAMLIHHGLLGMACFAADVPFDGCEGDGLDAVLGVAANC